MTHALEHHHELPDILSCFQALGGTNPVSLEHDPAGYVLEQRHCCPAWTAMIMGGPDGRQLVRELHESTCPELPRPDPIEQPA